MKAVLILIAGLFLALFACNKTETEITNEQADKYKGLGTLDINFVYRIQGVPADRLRKIDLSLAHTSDSLYRGWFFLSKNVSDAVTKYRFYLKPGIYYYQATITCLCAGDSCKWSGFPGGQYGLQMDGGKVSVVKDQLTEVTTQFH